MQISYKRLEKAFFRQPPSCTGWLLAGIAPAGIAGCSARVRQTKGQTTERQELTADTARYQLSLSRLSQQKGQTTLQWQQVMLSVPDSLGRQHPEQVTQALLGQQVETIEQDTSRLLAAHTTQTVRSSRSQQQTDTAAGSHSILCLWPVVLLLVCTLLFLFNKRKE